MSAAAATRALNPPQDPADGGPKLHKLLKQVVLIPECCNVAQRTKFRGNSGLWTRCKATDKPKNIIK